MATYTVIKSKHATLSPNVVDTIVLDTGGAPCMLFISSRGVGDIYFTVAIVGNTAETPSIKGDDVFVVLGNSTKIVDFGSALAEVKVISGSAVDYSVECIFQ